ncbi:MAG: branched-chain amino acid ABC transporter permease [Hyphomicrobiales bacterium]|nr:branched-chain amino acid ABC transporter permease [Hyphomicrobiales bacterium]
MVNGILLGGLYAAVTVGFSLVWGVMGIINVTHGSLIMLGAYITFALFAVFHVDPFLTIPVAALALFFVGYALQSLLINRVLTGGVLATLIITFGLDQIITNLTLLAFSADQRGASPSYARIVLELGDLLVPYVRLLVFISALALVGAVYLFLTYSKTGQAIRAVALNKLAAQLTGVDLARTYNITFAIGAALAGAAGALVATTYTISPLMGGHYLLKAFIITVLGGMGSLTGALVGGVVLGVSETFGALFFGTGYQEGVGVGLLLVVLTLRPRGLLGKRFFGEDQ